MSPPTDHRGRARPEDSSLGRSQCGIPDPLRWSGCARPLTTAAPSPFGERRTRAPGGPRTPSASPPSPRHESPLLARAARGTHRPSQAAPSIVPFGPRWPPLSQSRPRLAPPPARRPRQWSPSPAHRKPQTHHDSCVRPAFPRPGQEGRWPPPGRRLHRPPFSPSAPSSATPIRRHSSLPGLPLPRDLLSRSTERRHQHPPPSPRFRLGRALRRPATGGKACPPPLPSTAPCPAPLGDPPP